ncbi:MAG: hypothetical protein K6U89_07275 [Chloroflexi bacterium]|nr:hypothetical protein [Chloroflexota bacterium]GIW11239.1 MAG: hypothetical protein KatS3mg061_2296 [Dehalococcoidia bacterium]
MNTVNCYKCSNPAGGRCPTCRRLFCRFHGETYCHECQPPPPLWKSLLGLFRRR